MKRKKLCATKKGLAVMVAVAMMLSQSVVAMAETDTTVSAEATSGDVSKTAESASSTSDSPAAMGCSSGGHTAEVEVSGDVTSTGGESAATGVKAESDGAGSKTDISIGGGVSVSTSESTVFSAKGIEIGDVTDGGSVSVDVDEDVKVNVSGESYAGADGIDLGYAYESDYGSAGVLDGTLSINVDGSVDAETSGSGMARGIVGSIGDADVKISVGGDVKASSADGHSEGIQVEGATGNLQIDVGGDVIQDGPAGWAIGLNDGEGATDAVINVSVAGDVIADSTAVNVNKSEDDSIIDLVVEGTISAEEHTIVLNNDASTQNLNITVWKVDTSNNENIVENSEWVMTDESSEQVFTKNKKAEAAINYIIRVEPVETEGASLGVAGTKDSHGFYTAHEGDEVYLELTIPSGYEVDSFYSTDDATEVKVLSKDGKYYLVVPRGGGVDVGVKLKATGSNPSGGDDPTSTSEEKHEHYSKASHRHSADSTTSTGNNTKGAENTGNQGTPQVASGTGAPAEKTADVLTRVAAPQSIVVNGQEIPATVTIEANTDAVDQEFVSVLGELMTIGFSDLSNNAVAIPADAQIKESFNFAVAGMEAPGAMVQTVLTLANYQPGDILLCVYLDENGNPVVRAITPEMVNGNQLLVTIPANCRIAIAG